MADEVETKKKKNNNHRKKKDRIEERIRNRLTIMRLIITVVRVFQAPLLTS